MRLIVFHVALWEPEIPPNAGNVARLCAATGASLHLIGRLGFRLDDRRLKRAGLDYWPHVNMTHHPSWSDFLALGATQRIIPVTVHCQRTYTSLTYSDGDCLLFGNESNGLPAGIRDAHAETSVTIPMPARVVRCLNLATAVGIVLYEALRQCHRW